MLKEIVEQCRLKRPMVHAITNYVTANDCANLLLACGASPIMADDPEEAAEITAHCSGLVLNMGTPNPRRMEAMLASGREANRLGRPVIFDPVGVGSSEFRRKSALRLLESVRFSVIRGNADEIAVLTGGGSGWRGVDAAATQCAGAILENAARLAGRTGAVVVATGDTDIVTDGAVCHRILNGDAMMRSVTGAGCQLSSLVGAYAAANPDRLRTAALSAVCAMGLSGELARRRLSPWDGNAAYRSRIIDVIYNLVPETLEKEARYETEQ